MTVLSTSEALMLARNVGLSGDQAITAVAIAKAESGLNQAAVGDVKLVDRTWGPSIGLWQIRSLKAEKGTGGTRDETRLADPVFNARSMMKISGGGTSWRPWSTYTNGAYKQHLNAVRQAATGLAPKPAGGYKVGFGDYERAGTGNGPGGPAAGRGSSGSGGSGGGVQTVGLDLPGPDGMYGLGGLGLGLLNGGKNLLGSEADKLRAAVLEGAIWAAALGLGVSLVLIGTWGTVRKAAT
jgi:hypothetical protein